MVVRIRPDIQYFPQIATINLDELAEGNYNLTKREKLRQDPAQHSHNMSGASPSQSHKIFFPDCCDYGGFNDQIFWGPYMTMRYAMNTIYRIEALFGHHQKVYVLSAENGFKAALLDFVRLSFEASQGSRSILSPFLEVFKVDLPYCLGARGNRRKPCDGPPSHS
jgi:hypothetical protein